MLPVSPLSTHALSRTLAVAGAFSLGIGALAIALPAKMTLAIEILVAVLLPVWGAARLGVLAWVNVLTTGVSRLALAPAMR